MLSGGQLILTRDFNYYLQQGEWMYYVPATTHFSCAHMADFSWCSFLLKLDLALQSFQACVFSLTLQIDFSDLAPDLFLDLQLVNFGAS